VLQQAGMAMLAKANAPPNSVPTLLRVWDARDPWAP
jgi:flagellin-like hook-associated protein FlgL